VKGAIFGAGMFTFTGHQHMTTTTTAAAASNILPTVQALAKRTDMETCLQHSRNIFFSDSGPYKPVNPSKSRDICFYNHNNFSYYVYEKINGRSNLGL
jgi:hypothetical protein